MRPIQRKVQVGYPTAGPTRPGSPSQLAAGSVASCANSAAGKLVQESLPVREVSVGSHSGDACTFGHPTHGDRLGALVEEDLCVRFLTGVRPLGYCVGCGAMSCVAISTPYTKMCTPYTETSKS